MLSCEFSWHDSFAWIDPRSFSHSARDGTCGGRRWTNGTWGPGGPHLFLHAVWRAAGVDVCGQGSDGEPQRWCTRGANGVSNSEAQE